VNLPFSVIIPLYNKKPYIQRAIKSVLAQSYTEYEIIVVNDGSTDGGEEVVTAITDPGIILINQLNQGVSAARNKGVSRATYDYVVFIDADDSWESGFLAELNRLIHQLPGCGIYGINHRYITEKGVITVNDLDILLRYKLEVVINDYFTLFAKLGKSPFSNSGCCYPKSIFLEQGGYREGVRLTEDSDLWCRIALNHPIAFSGKVLVNYYYEIPDNTRSGFQTSDYQISLSLHQALKEKRVRPELQKGVKRLIAFQQLSLIKRAILTGHKNFALRKSFDKKFLRYYPFYPFFFFLLWLTPTFIINKFRKSTFPKISSPRVLFYSSVRTKKQFSYQEYYRTDIHILRDLNFRVFLSNRFSDFICFRKYDIAFIYFFRYGVIPAILARIFRKKVYFTGGIDFLEKSFIGKRGYLIQKFFFFFCHLFSTRCIIGSTSDRQNIQKSFPKINQRKLDFSAHVIDFDKYFSMDLPSKENIFTTIAWMKLSINVKRKGIDKCVYLFRELLKFPEFENSLLYIIGPPGEGSVMIENLVVSLNLQGKVILTGMVSEMEKINYLKKSKFYFQLSEQEGFGISAIEALASGNMVFHSGKGGLVDAIGNNGLLIPELPGYPEKAWYIHNYLKGLTEDQYKEKIGNGIDHVRNNFCYKKRKMDFQKIIQ